MSLSGEDGLDATHRAATRGDAPCAQEGPAQLCKGADGAHWFFTGGKKSPPSHFSLAAEGSIGAEVGRTGVAGPERANAKTCVRNRAFGGGETFSPVFERRMQQWGFVEGYFSCKVKSV